jgi:hypothetical protein
VVLRFDRKRQERRLDPRFNVDDPAEMRVLAPAPARPLDVRLVDISRNGAKIQVPQAVAPGSILELRTSKAVILAEARYCVSGDHTFYVGVQIREYELMHAGSTVAV